MISQKVSLEKALNEPQLADFRTQFEVPWMKNSRTEKKIGNLISTFNECNSSSVNLESKVKEKKPAVTAISGKHRGIDEEPQNMRTGRELLKEIVHSLITNGVEEPGYTQRSLIGYPMVWRHNFLIQRCEFSGEYLLGVSRCRSCAITDVEIC